MNLAYVGGGSLFVPSIVNGIGVASLMAMKKAHAPFGVELSLYDVRPERAARMPAYAEVVCNAYKRSDHVPLQARVADSRVEALSGADLVLVSVWLQEEHERLGQDGSQETSRNGYALWQERWRDLEHDPDYHPGNRGIRPILDLTGHLRSSAYHHWPYQVPETPQERMLWDAWQGKRALYTQALDEALQRGKPISDPPGIHPERSRLNYPFTGITVGKLVQSIATGQARDVLVPVIPLQVPNQGAISNFPNRVIVEVPTQVQGRAVRALPVGELPDWLGGYTRLLAIQRCLVAEYVFDRQLATLKQALATLPMFGTVHQLNRFAEALHEEFGAAFQSSRPPSRGRQIGL